MQLLQILRWLMQAMHDFDLARRRAEIFHFFFAPRCESGLIEKGGRATPAVRNKETGKKASPPAT